jgi:hypothetical protein
MNLRYRYTKLGNIIESNLNDEAEIVDHHSLVRAVLQRIANAENEVIAVDMISTTNPIFAIGKDVFFPDSGTENTSQTIQTVEISEDGESWDSVSIIR